MEIKIYFNRPEISAKLSRFILLWYRSKCNMLTNLQQLPQQVSQTYSSFPNRYHMGATELVSKFLFLHT